MYYNLPLFYCNVKIWRYIGFIEYENVYRIIPIMIIVLLTIICEFLHCFVVRQDLGFLILSLFMVAILLNSFIRIVIVMKNHKKFIKFMKVIESWYKEAELTNDIAAWSILKKLPKQTEVISKFGLIFGSFGGVVTAITPLLLSHRSHPYSVYIIGLDALKSPLYEIIYFVQMFVLMPFIICTYIPFTNLFITWLIFGIHILQVLRKKFEQLPGGNDPDQLRSLKALIKYHKRIIRYGESLEDLVSHVCFVELLLFTTMLSILLICLLLVDDIMFQVATVVYIICILYVLFLSYWHANEYSSESVKIADAVYSIDWTNSSIEVRKCVLILLMRCQTSLKISAGGMYPMTLEAFQVLLNAAYTYFNMARGFMAK
ncbi:odorant receptor Or2-like [Lucilia cuprina]|uniref:odorant receptor Or2-like n=1 Tax=Lucilia cuprina TaxID=7375 RepID=UPI001F059310|nr:odorant receptor Or2-like [Lucilia cuprina]